MLNIKELKTNDKVKGPSGITYRVLAINLKPTISIILEQKEYPILGMYSTTIITEQALERFEKC